LGLSEFSIRDRKIAPSLVLAPMSGVTNSCFRRLIKRNNPGAVGLLVTEFISIEALTRQSAQSLRMMQFAPEERPLSIQIFGHDISRMVDAAKMAQDAGADIVDINSGCPVPKVVKRGGGCELMRQPLHMAEMLSAVRRALSIPLTLKIRAGWDCQNRNAVEIARIAEESGVEMLAVHGRTRTEMYRGLADWDLVASVVDAVKIPVVGSGDVTDLASARERLAAGVSGLMIGRAALSNPWIFSELRAGLGADVDWSRPSDTATIDIIEEYLELLTAELPEKLVLGRMKQFMSQVTRRVPGSSQVRKALCMCHSVSEIREELARWRDYLEDRASSSQFLVPLVSEVQECSPLT
jgi:nifR3 family TIM-barrel protein